MLICVLLLLSAATAFGQQAADPTLLPDERNTNVLNPPYFNIATGKKIAATATCGTEGAERFCKLTGGTNFELYKSLYQGQVCGICDASDPRKAHPVRNAIDGTERWWQSPPLSRGDQYNKVNITIDLGQVFHVAYVLIKFANSPRAGTWVLERSSDHGASFQPWQYFANTVSDCFNFFGSDSQMEVTRDDSVLCTAEYSQVIPLENGEVIVPLVKGRPGANNFSYATVLQEWSKATNVRIRLLRTKTLLGHLMAVSEEDPTVTRRYYYSIKDISIGGRCVCNGHADRCSPARDDPYKLKCECQHNTCGDSCEMCCPGFVQKAWKAAVPESTNECEECNCHGHTSECVYDEEVARRRLSLDKYGEYEGGGRCLNCQHNTTGINCEQCAAGFWRPDYIDAADPYGCRPCECDSAYTLGTCEPTTGRCYCKPQYSGDRCDRCAPGYYDFPACKQCDCFYNGTRDDTCLPEGDSCPCKYNFAGMYCDQCAPTFYNFPECTPCECEGDGVASPTCDAETGACQCENGFAGDKCDQCAPGFYNYPYCRRCACSDVGTTSQVCDADSGECFCKERYTGSNCDNCKQGFFGFPLCQECACEMTGSVDNKCDVRSGKCACKPNFRGDACDQCAPNHYGYPLCSACRCDYSGSLDQNCDPVTGQCTCRENVQSRACDECLPGLFNFPACEECSCHEMGVRRVIPGVCLAFEEGQCDCKDNVEGVNCDKCKPLYYDITRGCLNCNCFVQGTLDGVAECDREDGQCFCKSYTCTKRCSQCSDGFYGLEERNYFGCQSCRCDVGGAMSGNCDISKGKCQCRRNVTGRRCHKPKKGHFFESLHAIRREFEDGFTPELRGVRFGFDESVFPDFSMRGYTEFSYIQDTIAVTVNVHQAGLYRLLVRYQNNRARRIGATVTLMSNDPDREDGVEQTYEVEFPVNVGSNRTTASTMFTLPTPFVLNRGTWKVIVKAEDGLMLDYFVLLPADYYEPTILQQRVAEPCKPESPSSGSGECIMFTHPQLMTYRNVFFNDFGSNDQIESPNTAHPGMLRLDYRGVDFNMRIKSARKYVIVLEYVNQNERLQKVNMTVSHGSTTVSSSFKIFHCPYSFVCRQVALNVLSGVQVFDLPNAKVQIELSTSSGDTVHLSRAYVIAYSDWSMEMVEPKAKCVARKGRDNRCVRSSYPVPAKAIKFEVPTQLSRRKVPRPDTISDASTPLVYLNGVRTQPSGPERSVTLEKNLEAGSYAFIIHYYNPDHMTIRSRVQITDVLGGNPIFSGTANTTYCPHAAGCRAVVSNDDGQVLVDVTSSSGTRVVIEVPDEMSMWIGYVLAVPRSVYDPSLFDVEASDKSGDFLRSCDVNSLHDPDSLSDFCHKSSFSLSVKYNNGASPCECSGAGTIGGADAQCKLNGGQCPCKDHVIGRQCNECKMGYYDFPNCKPCDCGGLLCDEDGKCVCPPNTVEPDCRSCQPFFHSWDVVRGCESCDCNMDGVATRADGSLDDKCDVSDGQCKCRENVTGRRCDRCAAGYYGFPNCQRCTCDPRGSDSDGCDYETGQCSCKKNVEGLRCDRCKQGSFYLHELNEDGCLKCFCFGKSDQCHFSQYPATEISDMEDWSLIGLKTKRPSIFFDRDEQKLTMVLSDSERRRKKPLYWGAPLAFKKNLVSSYGGKLTARRSHVVANTGRGDSASVSDSRELFTIVNNQRVPDLILASDDYEVGYTNKDAKTQQLALVFAERNFVHLSSGQPVTRPEMMRLLNGLTDIKILASPYVNVREISLSDVHLQTTDYDLPIGSGDPIPGVEECICPEGYTGHSCELCDRGHYRDEEANDFTCRRCGCYPNCDRCDHLGNLFSGDECLHNTGGENCNECKDGMYGNLTTDGVMTNCQPCPCPFPTKQGNFADSCELDTRTGGVVCACQRGYTGNNCEQCAEEYFGNPAVIGGTCEPCNCHGNLDPNLILETCDSRTGECSGCLYNTGGKFCERCADGFYGDAVTARDCRPCGCDECGTESCHHETGVCTCRPHVIGERCDRCADGFFGFRDDGCQGCQACECGLASLSSECDAVSGECLCAPNVVGRRCDACAPGFYDYGAEGCKPCKCRNNGPCNPVNGECECPPGVTGEQCNECELERHVINPGQTECEKCGKCTDDLLDAIEPLTAQIEDTLDTIGNVSVGVFAYKRLNDLSERIDAAQKLLDGNEVALEDAMSAVQDVAGADAIADFRSDVSGSGAATSEPASPSPSSRIFLTPGGDIYDGEESDEDEENEGVAGDGMKLARDFDERMRTLEAPVSAMCSEQENMTLVVNGTSMMGEQIAMVARFARNESHSFARDVRLLRDSMEEGYANNADELELNLREAQRRVNEMRAMDISPMQQAADNELELARQLLSKVETSFTDPSAVKNLEADAVLQELDERHEKLRDLRNKLNDAQNETNAARDTNAVNNKNLTRLANVVDRVSADLNDVTDDLVGAAQQMNRSAASMAEIETTTDKLDLLKDSLQTLVDEMDPVAERLNSSLDSLDRSLEAAVEHARDLREDVDALAAIEMAESAPTKVANRFRNITMAMEKAQLAADEAFEAATNASENAASMNLKKAARNAQRKANNLLTDTNEMENQRLADLQESIQETEDEVEMHGRATGDLLDRLDQLEREIAAFGEESSVPEQVVEIEARNEESGNVVKAVDKRLADIAAQLDPPVDVESDLPTDLKEIERMIDNASPQLQEEKLKGGQVTRQKNDLVRLNERLGINDKVEELRKQILITRNMANQVKTGMKFKAAEPHTATLRMPRVILDAAHALTVRLTVNVGAGAPNNHLMAVRGAAAGDDYLTLETVDGLVRLVFTVDGRRGEVVSRRRVDTGAWHVITASRIGNKGTLEVRQVADNTANRGDSTVDPNSLVDRTEGTTGGDGLKARMTWGAINIYIGRFPGQEAPSGNEAKSTFCIEDVTVNAEHVGIYNFEEYTSPERAQNCPESKIANQQVFQSWRFPGVDSYLRYDKSSSGFNARSPSSSGARKREARFIGFKVITSQHDGLLFVVGNTKEQFMAMEVVGGKLRLAWNFGFKDGPRNETVDSINDVTREGRLLIKAGYVPGRKLVAVSVNIRVVIKATWQGDYLPNFNSDVWIGGSWCKDIPDELEEHVINLRRHFRGCISDLQFNGRTRELDHAIENIGVSVGCSQETVQDLNLSGEDYIQATSGLHRATNVSGSLSFCSAGPSGGIITAIDSDAKEETRILLERGQVVLQSGGTELRSAKKYDDGRCHVVRFVAHRNERMAMWIDNDGMVEIGTVAPRTRREDFRNAWTFARSRVMLYIGGDMNSPLFKGCLKQIRIEHDTLHPDWFTTNMFCGQQGVTCIGTPLFNACERTYGDQPALRPPAAPESANDVPPALVHPEPAAAQPAPTFTRPVPLSEGADADEDDNRVGRPVNRQPEIVEIRGPELNGRPADGESEVVGTGAVAASGVDTCGAGSPTFRPETTGHYFSGEESYVKYQLRNVELSRWSYSLHFRTDQRRGILFFMTQNQMTPHIALFLAKGRLVYSVMIGQERSRLKSSPGFADGQWHEALFEREGHVTRLTVDGVVEDEGEIYALHRARRISIYVGGLHYLPRVNVKTIINPRNLVDYNGCIQNVSAWGVSLEEQEDTSSRHFRVTPCYAIKQPGMFFPAKESPAERASFVIYRQEYTVGENVQINFDFRPRTRSGVLLAVGGESGDYLTLVLLDGQLLLRVRQESDLLEQRYDPASFNLPGTLCDGLWHSVVVNKAQHVLFFEVDGHMVTPMATGTSGITYCNTTSPFFVGGIEEGYQVSGLAVEDQYVGCIRDLRVDNVPVDTERFKYGRVASVCPMENTN